jgi:hypothetical protein
MDAIDNFFGYIGISLIFINACLYVWSYRNFKNSVALKYFTFYLIINCIVTIISSIMAAKYINNLFLSHYYFVSQFILLSLFYRALFLPKQKKIVTFFLLSILVILIIKYILNPNLYYKFNLLEIFLTSVPIVVYSIVHLFNSLTRQGAFMFINSGILIYITISTLIFILGDLLSGYEGNSEISSIWLINKVLYVVYLGLILVEWYKLNMLRKSKL